MGTPQQAELQEREHALQVRRDRFLFCPDLCLALFRLQNSSGSYSGECNASLFRRQYRQATAFETLIGWWHENDKNRLDFILKLLEKELNF